MFGRKNTKIDIKERLNNLIVQNKEESIRFLKKEIDNIKEPIWKTIEKNGYPEDNRIVLTLSPIYKPNHLRYRILDAQFVKICKEVTMYVYLDELENLE